MVGVGLAGIAAALGMAWIGFNAPNSIPGRSYYTVHALFRDADNLTSHYQVRIAGRLVGQVLDPRVVHGLAEVDLQLDPSIKPLRSDTTVRVRPRSPIGVRFVELTPGTRGAPLRDGATIPASQTSAATELDSVLDTLDAPRRAEAETLLNQLGAGMVGRGQGLNDTIARAAPFLGATESTAAAVNARGGGPERLISGADSAAAAADPVRTVISSGWRPEAEALAPFSDHATGLRAALDAAPSALAGVRGGLAQTQPLVHELGAFAAAVQPTLRTAPAGLTQAAGLLHDAVPGLNDAGRTLDLARRATSPALTLLHQLTPVLPSVDGALNQSLPLVGALAPRECDYGMFARNWASMLAFGIPGGPLGVLDTLRLDLQGTDESVDLQQRRSSSVIAQPYPAPCSARSAP